MFGFLKNNSKTFSYFDTDSDSKIKSRALTFQEIKIPVKIMNELREIALTNKNEVGGHFVLNEDNVVVDMSRFEGTGRSVTVPVKDTLVHYHTHPFSEVVFTGMTQDPSAADIVNMIGKCYDKTRKHGREMTHLIIGARFFFINRPNDNIDQVGKDYALGDISDNDANVKFNKLLDDIKLDLRNAFIETSNQNFTFVANSMNEIFEYPHYLDLEYVEILIKEMDNMAFASKKYVEIVQQVLKKYGVDYSIRYYDAKKSDEFYYL